MFDKWKPLFLFLSEMIFVTFQNTFIAQMSTCLEGKQTRLTNNLLRFNYEGAVGKGNAHTSAVEDHTISLFYQIWIYDRI